MNGPPESHWNALNAATAWIAATLAAAVVAAIGFSLRVFLADRTMLLHHEELIQRVEERIDVMAKTMQAMVDSQQEIREQLGILRTNTEWIMKEMGEHREGRP